VELCVVSLFEESTGKYWVWHLGSNHNQEGYMVDSLENQHSNMSL